MQRSQALLPRREPRQERSRRQVNALLDAAAHVFAEVGYDTATTNAIAQRAGASIGSLYQFFPNKAAIFHALTLRYHTQLHDLLNQVMSIEMARLPLAQLIDTTINTFYTFARSEPGFTQIVQSARHSPELVATDNALIGESVERFAALLAARAPALDPERRLLLAKVSVEAADALLRLAIISESPLDEQVLAETKALLLAYLSPVIGEP
jgi:AcrR family transcriptional regulator